MSRSNKPKVYGTLRSTSAPEPSKIVYVAISKNTDSDKKLTEIIEIEEPHLLRIEFDPKNLEYIFVERMKQKQEKP